MADREIFKYDFILDSVADISIDFSAGQGYSTIQGNHPWQVTLYVDGGLNNSRGGSGAISDVVSLMGAANQMGPGSHTIQIFWYGSTAITLSGAVLRVLCTKR